MFPHLTDGDIKKLQLSVGGNITVRNFLAKIKVCTYIYVVTPFESRY